MARSIIKSWIATAIIFAATAAALSAPICQTKAPTQNTLNVPSANLTVPSNPFGLVYASNDIAFAVIGNEVGVLNTTTFTPTLVSGIALPSPFAKGAAGLTITRDKKTVFVAVGVGAAAIDVEKAVAGEADPVIGLLIGTAGAQAIEVTLSLYDDYVFVSQEYGNDIQTEIGAIDVFHVSRTSNGSVASTHIGYISLEMLVVGSALSPDGSKLYVTSETTPGSSQGTLSVLDVATLKTNPSQALLASVDAGCGAVRVVVSPHGRHVWVTARESNMLLGFDAAKVLSNSSDALVASVQVGTSPVGVTFVNHGRHLITADSNRFGYSGVATGLTVVDVGAALKGTQGFPRIPTGLFPREVAVSPDGKTLLVSQYESDAIGVYDVSKLPASA